MRRQEWTARGLPRGQVRSHISGQRIGTRPFTSAHRMAFHMEQAVPALVAAIAGTGTYGLQAANTVANPIPYLTLGMTVVSIVVAGAVAWGVQKADSRRTRADVEKLSALMLETVQRLSRIEAKLER